MPKYSVRLSLCICPDVKAPTQSTAAPEDVLVHLDFPDHRRKKIQNELELAIKRQLNKEKRDQQLLVHQGGVKEWLEQGNFINGTLNDTDLFQVALKLLPSAQAYPKDKADLAYFEQIIKWFVGKVTVYPDAPMYPAMVDDLDLKGSLRKQLEKTVVKSRRDYVLVFIILLRAIGIQCRMVINLVVPPIKPAASELCRITSKPKEERTGKKKVKEEHDDEDYEEKKPPKKNASAKKSLSVSKSPATEKNASSRTVAKRLTTSKKVKEEHDDEMEEHNEDKQLPKKKTPSKKILNVSQSSVTEKKPSSRTSKEATKVKQEIAGKPEPDKKLTAKKRKTSPEPGPSTSKKKISAKEVALLKSPPRARVTRSKTPSTNPIPQMDGMDDVVTASPVGKRTRSRTPIKPEAIKKQLVSQKSVESNIRTNTANKRNTLRVPVPGELFQKDPTEKVTVVLKSPEEPTNKPSRVDQVKKIDRRVLSTDDEETVKKPPEKPKDKTDFWIEVWSEKEEKWMCLDLFKRKLSSTGEILLKSATVPVTYVLAWNNNCTVKDVSLRYCPEWHSVNKKLRVDEKWLDDLLKPYQANTEKQKKMEQKEDRDLNELIRERPLPTKISEFKNHPLYALERHLLKFEAIYPPAPAILGYVHKEPIYARECVHILHSRELWVKQARVVKPGETPYKIVMARPKWDRATNTVIKDQPLELFGKWQTKEYEPPVAENGIVPKNAYGNVELFKACMLPINTVHLPCKELDDDHGIRII